MFDSFTKKLQENELYKLVVNKFENIESRLVHVDDEFVRTELYKTLIDRFEHIDDDFSKTSFAVSLVRSIGNLTKDMYSMIQSHIAAQKQIIELTKQVNALIQVVNITTPCVDRLAEEYIENHVTVSMPEVGETKVKKAPDRCN